MIEVINYLPNGYSKFKIGIKNHNLKTAAFIDNYFKVDSKFYTYESLNECYEKWDEWTNSNKLLLRFEE